MLNHLGIILDGNRRFAKKLMLKPWKGHEWGAKKVKELGRWSRDLGIKEVTLYCFSSENFNRPEAEKKYLFNLFDKEFTDLGSPEQLKELKEEDVRLEFIGHLHLFGKELEEKMQSLMEKTKKHSKHIIRFAMGYGGRQEILDAVSALAQKFREGSIKEITADIFAAHLYTTAEPDLIIRTGGEKRSSNFLPWQSTYSEWLYLDKPWPEFEKTDLIAAVTDFDQRQRRFGA